MGFDEEGPRGSSASGGGRRHRDSGRRAGCLNSTRLWSGACDGWRRGGVRNLSGFCVDHIGLQECVAIAYPKQHCWGGVRAVRACERLEARDSALSEARRAR